MSFAKEGSFLRTLILILVMFASSSGCHTSDRSDNSFRETIPKEVRTEIALQVRHFLGESSFQGIPLLDGRRDWTKAQNWPDDFSFRGHEFKARYATFGSDWFGGPNSRVVLDQRNTGYFIEYKVDLPAPLYWHSFSSFWSKHGYVREKNVTWGHKTVFSLQFYPSGNLLMFARDQLGSTYRIDVYDDTGRLLGVNDDHSHYTWEGEEITADEFGKNLRELWRNFPPEA